jgi:hypothetical protein
MTSRTLARQLAATLLIASSGLMVANAQQASVSERVAALKAGLAASQASLRQYEWIETTVVSLKGEEKSRKQQRCYYGADGVLQKVLIEATPPAAQKPGLRGRIIANKKEELSDYMRRAVSLVKSYVPPDPARIEGVKDAGKVTIAMLQPGRVARLDFHDYQKAGDNLGVALDLANNRPSGVTVSTYLDDPSDAILLDARMNQLSDGTTYTSDITLTAKAKDIQVTVQNSGYRKAS